MKLDQPGAAHQQPLAPPEWTMEMVKDGAQHIAIVFRMNTPMCRVSVATTERDGDAVRTALAEKAELGLPATWGAPNRRRMILLRAARTAHPG